MSSMLDAAKNTNIDKVNSVNDNTRYFCDLRPTPKNPWCGLKAGQKPEEYSWLKPTEEEPWLGLMAGQTYEPPYSRSDRYPWIGLKAGEKYDWYKAVSKDRSRIETWDDRISLINREEKELEITKIFKKYDYEPDTMIKDNLHVEFFAENGYNLWLLIDNEDYQVRRLVAGKSYGLDKLVYDKSVSVRSKVASKNYGFDILINDSDYRIRMMVAEAGYGLDKLVRDSNVAVRKTVVKMKYGLDILVNDPDPGVRMLVANQGYALDILINDESECVRREVVLWHYGLNKLIDDSSVIRACVRRTLVSFEMGIIQWMMEYPERVIEDITMEDETPEYFCDLRPTADKPWLGLKAHKLYKLDEAKENEYRHLLENTEFNRRSAACHGYALYTLIDDSDEAVRRDVAEQGYGLDVLVHDSYYYVRMMVAKQGYGLNLLINDALARSEVDDYLRKNNLTLEEWAEKYPERVV